jgi:hypothetical protein
MAQMDMTDPAEGGAASSLSPSADLTASVRTMMEAHWRPPGFTVPNARTYPWQWLWDSCFHAVIWAHLGEADRARTELACVFRHQDPSGFVPHLSYWGDDRHGGFWGRREASSITQPPMYGHAVATLARLGIEVDPELIERCRRGLRHLLDDRRHRSGLVALLHPWESGADNSPRWDHWCPGGFDVGRWFERKGELLASIERGPTGVPIGNRGFAVGSVSFSALVAWNARELGSIIDDRPLAHGASELADLLTDRWDRTLRTWIDAGDSEQDSGRIRTLDALLPLLVDDRTESVDGVLGQLTEPDAFGAPFGPRGVHRAEPTFARRTYWRGPAWPQLTYLLHRAADAAGRAPAAAELGRLLERGAAASGLAEYWDAEEGTGLGAIPQSWSGLAVAVS